MSRPRYPWWGYVKNIVRLYPEMKKEYMEIIAQKVTPSYGQNPHTAGAVSRTVEQTALRALSRGTAEEFEAVEKTIESTRKLVNGEERLKFIDMLYWKQSHTFYGAAANCNISYSTAKRWNQSFFYQVAKNRGLIGKR